jgi:hypothetical protein
VLKRALQPGEPATQCKAEVSRRVRRGVERSVSVERSVDVE